MGLYTYNIIKIKKMINNKKIKNLVALDLKSFKNYFLIVFKNIDNSNIIQIAVHGEDKRIDVKDCQKIRAILNTRLTSGFNSNNNQIPVILYALRSKTVSEIFNFQTNLLKGGAIGWRLLRDHDIMRPRAITHVDLAAVAGGKYTLNLYGSRLGCNNLYENIKSDDGIIDAVQTDDVVKACVNNLDIMGLIYHELVDAVNLRFEMSAEHNTDLLSCSDAQIAEKIIIIEMKKKNKNIDILNNKSKKVNSKETFKYNPPEIIQFKSKKLNDILKSIANTTFTINDAGTVRTPETLRKNFIKINKTNYKLGLGGLHSCEIKRALYETDACDLIDKDVSSYYPSLILNMGLYPKCLGSDFLDVYSNMVNERLDAKAKGETNKAKSLKIVINGTYGKLGNRYSVLYSPHNMIQVTITGQLLLLMLIENLENNGFSVLSANTDGITCQVLKTNVDQFNAICADWQKLTRLTLDTLKYKAVYSRDVNNYLAITKKGAVKGVGIFAPLGLNKNPHRQVSINAVINYLVDKKPLNLSIFECENIKDFITVRQVGGGAYYDNGDTVQLIGDVARWVYVGNNNKMRYVKNNNAVAYSSGGIPMLDITNYLEALPNTLAFGKYYDDAVDTLASVGITC